jgi:ferredoxin
LSFRQALGQVKSAILRDFIITDAREIMALLITHKCINCDMCEPECPNQAISMGEEIYQIDSDRCTECVGHYDKPTCQSVCPIDNTIIVDALHTETNEQLWDKFVLLHHAAQL